MSNELQKWIPVEEGYPKMGEDNLVIIEVPTENGYRCLPAWYARHDITGHVFIEYNGEDAGYDTHRDVTRWMPLPRPPSEQG